MNFNLEKHGKTLAVAIKMSRLVIGAPESDRILNLDLKLPAETFYPEWREVVVMDITKKAVALNQQQVDDMHDYRNRILQWMEENLMVENG